MKPAKQVYCPPLAQRSPSQHLMWTAQHLGCHISCRHPFAGIPQDVLAAPVLSGAQGCSCLAPLK